MADDFIEEMARRLEAHRRDPLGFVEWAFPWGVAGGPLANHTGPEQWQADVLRQIGDALREGKGPVRIAVASGHGVGKSALVAWLLLWALGHPALDARRGDGEHRDPAQDQDLGRARQMVRLVAHPRHLPRPRRTRRSRRNRPTTAPAASTCVPWAAHNAEAFAGLHNKGSRIAPGLRRGLGHRRPRSGKWLMAR